MEENIKEEFRIDKEDDLRDHTPPKARDNSLLIAGSIVFAGVLIAGAIVYSSVMGGGAVRNDTTPPSLGIKAVSKEDHILGSFDAQIKIVEYSDTECPFCKAYHTTLKKILEEYGPSGKVAWVYRHFPIEIHPKAFKEAEATECANELGGNLMFWKYIDHIFEITPSNNGLDPAELQKTANLLGLDMGAFNACLDSGKYAAKISESVDEATVAGAQGTPFSVMITKDGGQYEIKGGAVPYGNLKRIIDAALRL